MVDNLQFIVFSQMADIVTEQWIQIQQLEQALQMAEVFSYTTSHQFYAKYMKIYNLYNFVIPLNDLYFC